MIQNEKLIKIASNLCKNIPDRFWMPEDTEMLIDLLRQSFGLKISKYLLKDSKERAFQLQGIINTTLKNFPKKLNADQSQIIHKLNLEKALALNSKK